MCRVVKYVFFYFFFVTNILQATWYPPENVTSLSPVMATVSSPDIVTDSLGNATAVWLYEEDSHVSVLASTKPFGGSWQETPSVLTSIASNSNAPKIVVDSHDTVTAIWTTALGNIQVSTRVYGGSWQEIPDTISSEGVTSESPDLATNSSGNLVAVWVSNIGENSEVRAALKVNGETWGAGVKISGAGEHAAYAQVVLDTFGTATAVWAEGDSSHLDIVASTKTPEGFWQVTPDTLYAAPTMSAGYVPKIACDSFGNLVAVWYQMNLDFFSFVVVSCSKAYEGTWQSAEVLSNPEKMAGLPQIVMDAAGNATAVWSEESLETYQMYVQASTRPLGGSWQEIPDTLSDPQKECDWPDIAVDGQGTLLVVWDCDVDSVHTIQATTKTLGTGTWAPFSTISSEFKEDESSIEPKVVPYRSKYAMAIWPFTSDAGKAPQVASTLPNSPTVLRVHPHKGPSIGGTSVTITGSNFVNVTGVTFGGSSASFNVVSNTLMIVTSPISSAGKVDVRVVTESGTSPSTTNDQFSYYIPHVPHHPRKCRGVLTKRSHHHAHRYRLDTSWKRSTSSHLLAYRVYKRSQMVATIPVASQLKYKFYLHSRRSASTFSVDVVKRDGVASSKKRVWVHK